MDPPVPCSCIWSDAYLMPRKTPSTLVCRLHSAAEPSEVARLVSYLSATAGGQYWTTNPEKVGKIFHGQLREQDGRARYAGVGKVHVQLSKACGRPPIACPALLSGGPQRLLVASGKTYVQRKS